MPDILGTTGSKRNLYESDDSPVWCPRAGCWRNRVAGKTHGRKSALFGELETRLGELPEDREIACICASGSRSVAAARKLTAAGYTAISLTGGMMAWQRANLPIKTGSAR
jgi:rhodanese-related sulfurtransferase